MAPSSLLDFPPEIIINILAFLPVKSLLKFSETNRHAHDLARSSLHTLSLSIHSSKVSGLVSVLAATQYPNPTVIDSAFFPSTTSPAPPRFDFKSRRDSFELENSENQAAGSTDPHAISVLIPEGQSYGYKTLLNFHTALTSSILSRHGSTLRTLSLTLWTLTPPIAKATAALPALRALSIRIEEFPYIRSVPRHNVEPQRALQRAAWTTLCTTAVWASRLRALRIEGGEVTTSQVRSLVLGNRWLRELWLCRCVFVGSELWESLLGCEEWEGRTALRILGIMRCGGRIDEGRLEVVGGLKGLKFLSLLGCSGIDGEEIEKRNKDIWKIEECLVPHPQRTLGNADVTIEVDPLYM